MSKRGSLTHQMKLELERKFVPGMSKRAVVEAAMAAHPGAPPKEVRDAAIRDKIFSHQTLTTYTNECSAFAHFCKEKYNVKTWQECRPYVKEYLEKSIADGKSAWTVSAQGAALAKLYGVARKDFDVVFPERRRSDIKRGRGPSNTHFKEKNHQELFDFGRGTGLRKSEMKELKGENLKWINGKPYVEVMNGKGGKYRLSPIIGPNKDEIIKKIQSTPKGKKVWKQVPNAFNEHKCRADYAQALYTSLARPFDLIPASSRYFCRADKKGIVYDKDAMLITSKALGHNRIDVIALNYLY